jgi:hypothetical protein
MAVTYVRDENGQFIKVGPGAATTDTTLSQAGKPADAAAVGSALSNYATSAYVSSQLDNKAPKYTFGTTDLKEGTSTLAAGTLYFYYTTTELEEGAVLWVKHTLDLLTRLI